MSEGRLPNTPTLAAPRVMERIQKTGKPVQVYHDGYSFRVRRPSEKPHGGEDIGYYDSRIENGRILEDMEFHLKKH